MKVYQTVMSTIGDKGLEITEAKVGVEIGAGAAVKAVFLAPNGDGYSDLNDYSAVLQLTYGDTVFLFADVLKVGHHGSNTRRALRFEVGGC